VRIDRELGPDGALYVIEYGYYSTNPDAQLSRIEYVAPQKDTPSQ
jgi:hypothetical protein